MDSNKNPHKTFCATWCADYKTDMGVQRVKNSQQLWKELITVGELALPDYQTSNKAIIFKTEGISYWIKQTNEIE